MRFVLFPLAVGRVLVDVWSTVTVILRAVRPVSVLIIQRVR